MGKKYISDNKRIILITGDKDKWYEQAIFIVKKDVGTISNADALIDEAERIINSYLTENPEDEEESSYTPIVSVNNKINRRKSPLAAFLNLLLVCVASGFFVLLLQNIFW
ncbi:MAG: hypothetical protein FWC95_06380 [Defluviitaleaceae bacterium]|nr:hypothetical protein [Defluviitaleaceae bacterium]